MLFIFSTPVLIRHLWQLETVVFLHWCIICAVLLLVVIKTHSFGYNLLEPKLKNKKYFLIESGLRLSMFLKRVLHQGPELRESKLTLICLVIIIILIGYIILYYIIIKLLIMENHPSQNRKRNSIVYVYYLLWDIIALG